MPASSAPATAPADRNAVSGEPAVHGGYQAGGSIGALHDRLEHRLSAEARPALPAQPVHWAERAVSLFSRALGPALLIAGYFVVARLLFH